MESKMKIGKHSIHKMLIVFPVGLLTTAVVFDLIYFFTKNSTWADTAFYVLGGGIIGGLVAAPFGWLDWFAIPKNTRVKSVGLMHGLGNVIVLLAFMGSWVLRWSNLNPTALALGYVLSSVGVLLMFGTAWLGGELVDRLGVSIASDANLNATGAQESLLRFETEKAREASKPIKAA